MTNIHKLIVTLLFIELFSLGIGQHQQKYMQNNEQNRRTTINKKKKTRMMFNRYIYHCVQ